MNCQTRSRLEEEVESEGRGRGLCVMQRSVGTTSSRLPVLFPFPVRVSKGSETSTSGNPSRKVHRHQGGSTKFKSPVDPKVLVRVTVHYLEGGDASILQAMDLYPSQGNPYLVKCLCFLVSKKSDYTFQGTCYVY